MLGGLSTKNPEAFVTKGLVDLWRRRCAEGCVLIVKDGGVSTKNPNAFVMEG